MVRKVCRSQNVNKSGNKSSVGSIGKSPSHPEPDIPHFFFLPDVLLSHLARGLILVCVCRGKSGLGEISIPIDA